MAIKKEIELEVKVDSVGTLKQQLKEAQREVEALAAKFGATSEQATNAAKKAAELKDQIGDAKALTDAFNPDAKFNAFGSALQGVAGGFSAVQGAMGLIGVESSAVEATLLKVQSAMALSQGINSVLAAKDSFTNLAAVIGKTALGQKLLTAAQVAGAATMRVLNVVMAANPVLLIVSGVTALAGALYMLVSSQEAAEVSAADLNKELEKQQDVLEQNTKDIENYSKLDIARARERGASEEELTKIKKKAAKDQIVLLYNNYLETQKTYDKIYELYRKDLATVEEYNEAKKKEQEAYTKFNDAKMAKIVSDAEADADKAEKKREDQAKKAEEAARKAEEKRKKAAEAAKAAAEKAAEEKKKRDEEDAKNEEAFLLSAKDRNKNFNDTIRQNDIEADNIKRKAVSDFREYIKLQNEKDLEEARLKAEEELRIEKEKEEAKKQLRANQIQGTLDTLSTIANISQLFAGKSKAEQEKAFKIQKAINIATAVIDTYKAANAALASAPPPFSFIAMGAAITAGLLNVKKIASQQFNGGGSSSGGGGFSGGGSSPSGMNGSTVITPNFNIVGNNGQNQLGQLGSPIQAYVVSSDMTSQQQLDRNRLRNATF
jgi:membrane protein involved in colicin uptake